ncbi:AIR synthase [Halococcus sp. IIIV-5B]|uniref:AIR synthase n=1 Tax=Halococcus sp. IIIV-5B TaxID=2321230 RepID=UPI000E726B91|nr:AIR synthase [Halococcus sp. IIIV-5B]RJS98256.1 AIR synthase [Halococcus sp. IIIV-5B]
MSTLGTVDRRLLDGHVHPNRGATTRACEVHPEHDPCRATVDALAERAAGGE